MSEVMNLQEKNMRKHSTSIGLLMMYEYIPLGHKVSRFNADLPTSLVHMIPAGMIHTNNTRRFVESLRESRSMIEYRQISEDRPKYRNRFFCRSFQIIDRHRFQETISNTGIYVPVYIYFVCMT